MSEVKFKKPDPAICKAYYEALVALAPEMGYKETSLGMAYASATVAMDIFAKVGVRFDQIEGFLKARHQLYDTIYTTLREVSGENNDHAPIDSPEQIASSGN